jgi:hypothetical protein
MIAQIGLIVNKNMMARKVASSNGTGQKQEYPQSGPPLQEPTPQGKATLGKIRSGNLFIASGCATRHVGHPADSVKYIDPVTDSGKIYGPNSIQGPYFGINAMPPATNITEP